MDNLFLSSIKLNFNKLLPFLLFVLFPLSLYVDNRFSFLLSGVTPIRIYLPFLGGMVLLVLFFVYKKRIYFDLIAKVMVLLNLLHLFSLTYTNDLVAGIKLNLFWVSLLGLYLSLLNLKIKVSVLTKVFFISVLFTSLITTVISFIKYYAFFFKQKVLIWGYQGRHVISSIIEDENHYSLYLSIIYFLNSYILYSTKKVYIKVLVFTVMLCSTFLLVGTLSRSGMLSFLFAYLVFNIFYFFFTSKNVIAKKSITFFILLFLLNPLTLVFSDKAFSFTFSEGRDNNLKNNVTVSEEKKAKQNSMLPDSFYAEVLSRDVGAKQFIDNLPFPFKSPSTKSHLALIYSSFVIGSNNLLLGVGAGGFDEAVNNYSLDNLFAKYDPGAAVSGKFPAHTMYGHFFAELGLVGFVVYLLLLFLIIKRFAVGTLFAKKDSIKILNLSFLCVSLSMVLFTFFYNLHEEWFWVPILIGLAISNKQ